MVPSLTLIKEAAPVYAALVAAAAALIGVLVNTVVTWKLAHRQKALERFKIELQATLSNQQAMTAYRFDARRRLYTECEPIFFQLREAAHDAFSLIPRFCEAEFQQALKAKRENSVAGDYWMLSDSSTTIYALYCLLRPLALHCLLKRKMTEVDLSLDAGVLFRYELARELYACLCKEADIAQVSPRVDYDPLVSDWRQKRSTDPAKHWWQGATPGRLENGIACLIKQNRVISFGTFEDLYLSAYNEKDSPHQKRLGVVASALYDFQPMKRPVFWRVLIVKAHLYAALVKPVPEDIKEVRGSPHRLREHLRLPQEASECFDRVSESAKADPPLAKTDLGLHFLVEHLVARS